jgi:hypothetical protein
MFKVLLKTIESSTCAAEEVIGVDRNCTINRRSYNNRIKNGQLQVNFQVSKIAKGITGCSQHGRRYGVVSCNLHLIICI